MAFSLIPKTISPNLPLVDTGKASGWATTKRGGGFTTDSSGNHPIPVTYGTPYVWVDSVDWGAIERGDYTLVDPQPAPPAGKYITVSKGDNPWSGDSHWGMLPSSYSKDTGAFFVALHNFPPPPPDYPFPNDPTYPLDDMLPAPSTDGARYGGLSSGHGWEWLGWQKMVLWRRPGVDPGNTQAAIDRLTPKCRKFFAEDSRHSAKGGEEVNTGIAVAMGVALAATVAAGVITSVAAAGAAGGGASGGAAASGGTIATGGAVTGTGGGAAAAGGTITGGVAGGGGISGTLGGLGTAALGTAAKIGIPIALGAATSALGLTPKPGGSTTPLAPGQTEQTETVQPITPDTILGNVDEKDIMVYGGLALVAILILVK